MKNIHKDLQLINQKPEIWSQYTAETLWNDPHISKQMLDLHLNENVDPASRKKEFIDNSLSWITDKFYIKNDIHIADFGCGPGLYAIPFAIKGAQVTAIDFSKRSISYAQESAKSSNVSVEFINENYLDFKTSKRFDLITMIYCDFCALSPLQRKKLLSTFNEILADNGSILLDVFSLSSYRNREEEAVYSENLMEGFWSGNDYYGFANTFKYDIEKVICDKYTIFEENKTWQVFNWLQYYTIDSLNKECRDNGFQISEFFGDVKGSPHTEQSNEIAVILKRS